MVTPEAATRIVPSYKSPSEKFVASENSPNLQTENESKQKLAQK